MDIVLQRRRTALTRTATTHDRSADFYRGLSQALDTIGDDDNAAEARALAEHHDLCASHERELAMQTLAYR